MANTLLPAATSLLSGILPPAEFARVVRLAIDTLVSIVSDAKAGVAERRRAAMTILALAKPGPKRAPQRAGSASSRCTSDSEPVSPAPAPISASAPALHAPSPTRDPDPFSPRKSDARTHRLVAAAGAAPISSRAPPSRLTG